MTSRTKWLLVVTADGYGKRIAVGEIRHLKNRGGLGVSVSKHHLAAALVVDDSVPECILQATHGKTQRLRVKDVPTRRRGNVRGARIMRLDRCKKGAVGEDGTRLPCKKCKATGYESVVAVAPVAEVAEDAPETPVSPDPATNTTQPWVGGRVGLREGESVVEQCLFAPLRAPADIKVGGVLPFERGEWARTDVHRLSSYWCAHCGRRHDDPHAVYECIDRHATEAAG